MTILSKRDMIRRIMVGEMLINPDKKDLIGKCLSKSKKTEGFLLCARAYFEKLASDSKNLSERKMAIKEYVEKNFLHKNASEIKKIIGGMEDLKDYKEIDPPIFINDFDFKSIQMANYDLRLGEDIYVTTERVPKKLNIMGKDGVVAIEPGEFGILMTYEYIFVPPDLMGFISIRLSHKQKGLVNISGFHVDPGYYGKLMFAVFNAGPNDTPLRYKEPVFMIMFNELTSDGPKVEESKWSGMDNIPIETLSGLRGTSVSVRNLDERVKRLEMIFPVVLTGVVSIAVAVIAWVLTQ